MNNLKMIIYCLITGVIVFTGSIYASTKYMANQIAYTTEYNNKITTAEDAMNDLYKTTSNYMSGKYSEEETVVGEWIDGKPIYRKVIIKSATLGNYWQKYCLLSEISLQISTMIRATTYQDGVTGNVPIWANKNGDYLQILSAGGLSGMPINGIVFEYTKTTD